MLGSVPQAAPRLGVKEEWADADLDQGRALHRLTTAQRKLEQVYACCCDWRTSKPPMWSKLPGRAIEVTYSYVA